MAFFNNIRCACRNTFSISLTKMKFADFYVLLLSPKLLLPTAQHIYLFICSECNKIL